MKVLHIASSDLLDSASRSASELHRALLQAGVESRFLVAHRSTPQNDRLPPNDSDEAGLLQAFCFDQNESSPTATAFHLGYPGNPMAHFAHDCDLIHLHQIAGALSPADLRQLAALGKPVVWSLSDSWAFTGGCFEPGACSQLANGCADCPQLREDSFHLPARLLEDKRALLSGLPNLTLIAPNKFLATKAAASPIFNTTRIELIAPLVAERPATPNLPAERPLRIVFVCDSPGSQARGARLLADLLEVTQTYGAFRKLVGSGKVTLAASGLSPELTAAIELPLECGAPDSADLLVFPKPDENRTAAVLEAGGVPILAFNQGGIEEQIEHRKNGWLVQRPELRPLAEALCYLAANPDIVRSMAQPPAVSNAAALAKLQALYQSLLTAPILSSPPILPSSLQPHFQKILCSIAQLALSNRANELKLARLDSAEKRATGAEQLLAEAQKSLASLERRHQRLADSGQLPHSATQELLKIQKSTASLRNKLKWRARRLKIFSAPEIVGAKGGVGPQQAPPAIPAWAQLAHRLFLKNHWMKHGKKDQYPPRPMRAETFPKPKLRDSLLPKIAIVTPSFMQGDYLEATILSVIDQGYPNLAYAVHDGGSTDSSLEVIRRHADRITLWASQPDSGQARAIVSGFEKIKGQIMAWVNSDDLLVAGSLRYIGEYFAAHPEVDAIYGNRIIVNEHGKEIARWVLPPHQPAITPFIDPVPQETLFWRESLWEKVGGLDPSFRFALDWDLLLRFQKAGANIVRLPYFLGCFRVHSQQKLSARAESIGAEEIAYLRQRETGGPVTLQQIQPYKEWMETSAALYSRMLELGIRR